MRPESNLSRRVSYCRTGYCPHRKRAFEVHYFVLLVVCKACYNERPESPLRLLYCADGLSWALPPPPYFRFRRPRNPRHRHSMGNPLDSTYVGPLYLR